MPRTRSLAWAELKIGLLSLFAIMMAAALILLLSGEGGFFWQRYPIKAVFNNIAGLKPGAPVRLAGVEVGSVTGVAFVGDRVEVTMEVGREHQPRITTTSVASLGTVSLLGEAAVDITASSGGTPIPDWGYVRSGPAAGSLAEVTTQASEGIEELTRLLQGVRAGRGTIGQFFTNDSLYRELDALVSAAEAVASNVNAGRGTIGRLVNDPAAARALEAALQNLEAVTGRIRSGEGSLGRLVADDAFGQSLTSTSANLDAITARISRGEGTAGALVHDRQLYDRLSSMSDRLDRLIAALNAGEGTAGQLLRDRQLYDNMNSAVTELRDLISNISQDPRKYLTVRVSLF
ncbi:MAG TPA: MlaD family protein [Vicinamibacterales bacterium]|nr:MlaD family protein [Vicinamibacterales bacterium]